MNDDVRVALREGGVIDITTTGRKTGDPRRKEIVFHSIGGDLHQRDLSPAETRLAAEP